MYSLYGPYWGWKCETLFYDIAKEGNSLRAALTRPDVRLSPLALECGTCTHCLRFSKIEAQPQEQALKFACIKHVAKTRQLLLKKTLSSGPAHHTHFSSAILESSAHNVESTQNFWKSAKDTSEHEALITRRKNRSQSLTMGNAWIFIPSNQTEKDPL